MGDSETDIHYPPATPHSHNTTNKWDSESVWASLMRKQGAPEGSRKAPGVGRRASNNYNEQRSETQYKVSTKCLSTSSQAQHVDLGLINLFPLEYQTNIGSSGKSSNSSDKLGYHLGRREVVLLRRIPNWLVLDKITLFLWEEISILLTRIKHTWDSSHGELLTLGEDPQFFPQEPDFFPSELYISSGDKESEALYARTHSKSLLTSVLLNRI